MTALAVAKMKKDRLILLTILLTSLVACRKEVPADTPLVFTDVQTKVGLSSYYKDFKVWGYCLAESDSDIMTGYKVIHDDALGWCYTEIPGTEGQELQYWSYSASLYRFHAGAPFERVKAMDSSSLTLQMDTTTSISKTSLFTEPCLIKRGDPAFGSTVNLAFVYANAKLNLAFKCASSVNVSITDIKLTPPSGAYYATSGKLELQYDWDRPAVSVKALTVDSKSSAPLAFPDVSVQAGTTDAVQTKSPWYLIPQDDSAKGQWKMSATIIDGSPKPMEVEVYFTLSKGWEAGKSYLFRFEYTDEARLVFLGTEECLFIGKAPEDGGNHNFS